MNLTTLHHVLRLYIFVTVTQNFLFIIINNFSYMFRSKLIVIIM
jgi:hypothetical protein